MGKKPERYDEIEVETGVDQRRDDVLRRMLKTPPKSRAPKPVKPKKSKSS